MRCPVCVWKPGLVDAGTVCNSCGGSGELSGEVVKKEKTSRVRSKIKSIANKFSRKGKK